MNDGSNGAVTTFITDQTYELYLVFDQMGNTVKDGSESHLDLGGPPIISMQQHTGKFCVGESHVYFLQKM